MEELGKKAGVKIAKGILGKVRGVLGIGEAEIEISEKGIRARAPSVEMAKELLDYGAQKLLEISPTREVREKARDKMREALIQPVPEVEAPSEEQAFLAALRLLDDGDSKFEADDFAGAEKAYREASEMAAKSGNESLQSLCLNVLGAALGAQGKDEEALPLFEKALSFLPNDASTWCNKGMTLAGLQRVEEAIWCFDKAIKLKLDFTDAWNLKGAVLSDVGSHEEAISCFDKALELESANGMAWFGKGTVLGKLGRYDEALSYFEKTTSLKPDFASAWYYKGVTFLVLGQFDKALSSSEKALELDPGTAVAWDVRGAALLGLERWDEALASFERLLELNPQHAVAWDGKGSALYMLKRFEEAKKSFGKALSLKEELPNKGVTAFTGLAMIIIFQGLESVVAGNIGEARKKASELAQLSKKADKDDMAQVVGEAIAEFKGGLPKKLLKDFRNFEAMLEEAKSHD